MPRFCLWLVTTSLCLITFLLTFLNAFLLLLHMTPSFGILAFRNCSICSELSFLPSNFLNNKLPALSVAANTATFFGFCFTSFNLYTLYTTKRLQSILKKFKVYTQYKTKQSLHLYGNSLLGIFLIYRPHIISLLIPTSNLTTQPQKPPLWTCFLEPKKSCY